MSPEKKPRPIVALLMLLIGGTSALYIGWLRLLSLLGPSLSVIPLFFIVYGIILVIGFSDIYKHPEKHREWGIGILIVSISIGFLEVLQSFILRALLIQRAHAIDPIIEIMIVIIATVGGVLSIVWKPTPTGA